MRLQHFLYALPLFLAPTAQAQNCTASPAESLQDLAASAGTQFGHAVAVDGDHALVSSMLRPTSCGNSTCRPGSVYQYQFSNGTWQEHAIVDGRNNRDLFGWSLALEGMTAVIGAPDEQSLGTANVYRFDGTSWVETQTLMASDGQVEDQFGFSLALQGNWLAVGAPVTYGSPTGIGRVYLYRHDGSQWVQEQILNPADNTSFAHFGHALALDGNVLLVGAFADDENGNNAGAGYIYRRNGNLWDLEEKLLPADGLDYQNLGSAVALDGDVALLGAPWDDGPCPSYQADCNAGSAYVFRFDGAAWREEQKITDPQVTSQANLGAQVALEDGMAVVGASNYPAGSFALACKDVGQSWVQAQRLDARAGHARAYYGTGLQIENGVVYLGTHYTPNGNRGELELFPVPEMALMANPSSVRVGQTLYFTSCGGAPGNPALLIATRMGGQPIFHPMPVLGICAPDGTWNLSGPITSSPLMDVDFQTWGIDAEGKLVSSNEVTVNFR